MTKRIHYSIGPTWLSLDLGENIWYCCEKLVKHFLLLTKSLTITWNPYPSKKVGQIPLMQESHIVTLNPMKYIKLGDVSALEMYHVGLWILLDTRNYILHIFT